MKYASIRQEMEHSIDQGNDYLKSHQNADGSWGDTRFPAMTALAITAAMRSPENQGKPVPEYLKKGYEFILASQKEDGSIYNRGLASYNTAVCMLALLAANNPAYDQPILKARAYLIQQQSHFAPDSPYYGGIGYGGPDAPPIADLSNTSLALEAIYYSRKLAQDGKYGPQPELDWDAAVAFITSCQENPATNSRARETNDLKQQGGFRYRPVNSDSAPKHAMPTGKPDFVQGGEHQGNGKPPWAGQGGQSGRPDGQGAPQSPQGVATAQGGQPGAQQGGHPGMGGRGGHPGMGGMGGGRGGMGGGMGGGKGSEPALAYGSMTYAGMQSLIYANLSKDDPRVTAALGWLKNNYSIEENPGMGIQGLYYYYQAMAKAMSSAGIDEFTLADGTEVDWRDDLGQRLIRIQKSDGSWVNTDNRWWEADPILVTCYSVLSLEQIFNSIPR
jgi:hypothetical protein